MFRAIGNARIDVRTVSSCCSFLASRLARSVDVETLLTLDPIVLWSESLYGEVCETKMKKKKKKRERGSRSQACGEDQVWRFPFYS